MTPCRVLDTRSRNGHLGGPFLTGGTERDFSVLESSCIPQRPEHHGVLFQLHGGAESGGAATGLFDGVAGGQYSADHLHPE
jgi:hypothetical protein